MGPGTAKPTLQVRKQEFARDAIWSASIDLFLENGFDETTIDDIVDAAGTSRRTFFRHFESKRDLMAQPVATYGASFAAAIESAPPNAPPPDLFRHMVTEVARLTVADARMRKVMKIAARYPAAREAQVSRLAELQDRLAEALAERCEDAVAAHALAALTLSALSLSYRVWFSEGNQDIGSAVERALAAIASIAHG